MIDIQSGKTPPTDRWSGAKTCHNQVGRWRYTSGLKRRILSGPVRVYKGPCLLLAFGAQNPHKIIHVEGERGRRMGSGLRQFLLPLANVQPRNVGFLKGDLCGSNHPHLYQEKLLRTQRCNWVLWCRGMSQSVPFPGAPKMEIALFSFHWGMLGLWH